MPRAAEPVKAGLTFEEYLEFERVSPEKHEFVDSQLFEKARENDRHNRLTLFLAVRLEENRTSDSRVYLLDIKIRTPDDVGYYPDVLVTCDESDDGTYIKRKPCLILEVLSDSTEATDRGEKLRNYLKLKSLQGYVLVSQNEPRLEMFRREENGWRYEVKEAGETLTLPCLDLELVVDELYAGL